MSNNLVITQDARFDTEFGKYPVLHVNFAVCGSAPAIVPLLTFHANCTKNVIGSTVGDMLQEFKIQVMRVVQRLYNQGFLPNLDRLSNYQQEFLDAVLNEKLSDPRCDTVLLELTELLYTLHERRVVVLVDEYDTPTSYAVQHGYFSQVCLVYWRIMHTSQPLSQANEFFRTVFSALLKVGLFFHCINLSLTQNCRTMNIFEVP